MPENRLGVNLESLAARLDQLAEEAAGEQAGQATGYPPGYWCGVVFGFETAAGEVREMVAGANGNGHRNGQ